LRSLRHVLPLVTLTLGVGGMVLLAPPAVAAVPAVAPERAPLHSNTELARALAGIEQASRGRVDVRSIGTSNEGRPLWLATVGTGPVRLLYVTQQHGDEPLGTESAIQVLRTIGVGNGAWARWLRSKITLGIVIRANPDGHERDWRYNFDPDAQPEFGEPGQGYDINRYHNPDLAPEDNPVPEAAAIQRTWLAFRPSIVVDYHMQGRYRFPDGREITTSVMWPTSPLAAPAAVERSKQVTVALYDAFTAAGGVVSQYPGGDYEGIARNAYGIRGSASVLVELSAIPGRERFQIATAYHSMIAVAGAAGTGALGGIDPARADAIPERGPALPGTGAGSLELAGAA
jgi:hypothetical protein